MAFASFKKVKFESQYSSKATNIFSLIRDYIFMIPHVLFTKRTDLDYN